MSYTTVKYSLSPRQAMYLDIPIGDPYGGPAYGQKLKGGGGLGMVLGVVAAVATGGAGLAAWSAASGFAAHLAAGAMVAGGVMSGIGAVTGNKKLAKYGGILSIAGGLGSSLMTSSGEFLNPLADNAGKSSLMSDAMTKVSETFSSTADKLGFGGDKASQAVSGVNQTVTGNGTSALTQASPNMSVAPTMTDAAGQFSGVNQTLGQSVPGMGATDYSLTGGTLNSSGTVGNSAMTGASDGLRMASGGGVQAPYVSQYPGANAVVSPLSQTAAPATGGAFDAVKNAGSSVLDFAKTNGGGLIGASLMQGLGGAMGQQEQLDFLQQQYQDKQDLLQKELANINFRYEALDPNDPQYEQKKAAAKSAGIPTITIGINKNANIAPPNLYNATLPQAGATTQGV